MTLRSVLFSAAFLLSLLLIPLSRAEAQSRDAGLDAVHELAGEVVNIADGNGSDRDVFVGVQALTDALRRFILAETEIRADQPVGPPQDASLRPGQAADEGDFVPGPEKSLSDVPTPWFNLHANRALEALESVRDEIDSGAPRTAITEWLRQIQSALSDINRPPST